MRNAVSLVLYGGSFRVYLCNTYWSLQKHPNVWDLLYTPIGPFQSAQWLVWITSLLARLDHQWWGFSWFTLDQLPPGPVALLHGLTQNKNKLVALFSLESHTSGLEVHRAQIWESCHPFISLLPIVIQTQSSEYQEIISRLWKTHCRHCLKESYPDCPIHLFCC